MKRLRIAAATPYAAGLGYSRLVAVGDLAWIAGCAPLTPEGALTHPQCALSQTRQCIAMIGDALEQGGFALKDVVRTRIYLRSFDDTPAIMQAHHEAFGTILPACTVISVSEHVKPGMRVYMDADACRAAS